jgi:hypothetical protein
MSGGSRLQSDQLLDARLRRLAKDIEELAGKDETALRYSREIEALRRRAAVQLFEVCASFVDRINGLLATPKVQLDPQQFSEENFHEEGANLLQINVRGRILPVEFEATPDLVSTEDFRVPYILSGAVRAFNQELLDKDLVEEQLIFYTLEKEKTLWRYFDARTYRSGELDQEYLVGLMEQLL